MSIVDQVWGHLSHDHAWRTEERQWQSSGQFPDEFCRRYGSEQSFQKDEVRLQSIGYRAVQADKDQSLVRTRRRAVPSGLTVTYQRSMNPLLAPGAKLSDEPE